MKKLCDQIVAALREKPTRFGYVVLALLLGVIFVQTGLAGASLDQVIGYLMR